MSRKIDEFEWVNRNYGLRLVRGLRLKVADTKTAGRHAGRKGSVARGDGQYIYILFDGEAKPQGPFHPTSDILYETDLQSKEPDCPEHRKLQAVKKESQTVGEFLDWLMEEKKLELAFYHKHGPACDGWNEEEQKIDRVYVYDCAKKHQHDAVFCERHVESGCDMPQETLIAARADKVKLLAEFFSIDQAKLEKEKDLMLDFIRKNNEKVEAK